MTRSVLIETERLPETFHWDPRSYRRGTEEFYTRSSEALLKLGFDEVVVAYDGPYVVHNGVEYLNRSHPRCQESGTVLTCNTEPVAVANRRVCWSNQYGKRLVDVASAAFDAYVVLSPFHETVFMTGCGDHGDADRVHVIGHGCDPIPAQEKAPIVAYTSSPDRGLEFLKRIWPEIGAATGYKLVPADGSLTNEEMNYLYAKARFWIHPGLGIELFCLSALKAQAAGCVPLVVPHMALADTVKFGLKAGSLFEFKDRIIETIRNPPEIPADFKAPTWLEATAPLAALLRGD
jgi:glycosyltransferase involved in cell wall biosynthesis